MHRLHGQLAVDVHDDRAIYSHRAQVRGRLIEHQLEPVAVKVGVALPRDDQRALPLAIGHQELDFDEHLASPSALLGPVSLRKVGEKRVHAPDLVRNRVLHLLEQTPLALQLPELVAHPALVD